MNKVLEEICYCNQCQKHTTHYKVLIQNCCEDTIDICVCSECSVAFSLLTELVDFLQKECCKQDEN